MINKKKSTKSSQVHQFKKRTTKLLVYTAVLLIIIFSFFLGIFVEHLYSIVQKNDVIYRFLNNINYSEDINYYELRVDDLRNAIYDFVQQYFQEDDPEYIAEVTDAFVELFEVDDENKHYILYFIALCCVESNFRMSARSNAGAVGISQIMWNIWGDSIKKHYGINKEAIYTSIGDNIYVGYKIWKNFLKQNNYNIRLANAKYLGVDSSSYNERINARYIYLINSILKRALNDEVYIKRI